MCVLAAQKASLTLDCNKRGLASRDREVIFFCSALMRSVPDVLCAALGPSYINLFEWVHRRIMKMIRALEELSHENRPKK